VATRVEALERLDPDNARAFHHVPGLDGLRAVAVLLVIGLHYGSLWDHERNGGLLPGGFLGVDIFFVLSGFLITSLLVGEKAKTGGVSLPKFYARRALRLFPALAFILVVHFLYTLWIGASITSEVKQILSVVFYVSNFAQSYFLPEMLKSGLSFTWSLAIEEQFYLLWPAVLVFGVLRYCKSRRAVLSVIGAAIIASALIRFVVWNWGGEYPEAYMRPDCRADGLLIGAFCAFAWRWGLVPRRYLKQAAMLCAAGLVATAVFVVSGPAMFNYGFLLVSLATGVIILAIAENNTNLLPILEWAPLRSIGKVSYGLYLWHVLSLRIVHHALPDASRVPLALMALALMSVAVTVSWRFVEQPFLRLKSRVASPVSH
jgi:peptidoglycan/LPS O-acetylase OafA/YrhL